MPMTGHGTNRRQFFRDRGLAAGTLAGLGLDLKPAGRPRRSSRSRARARCRASAPTAPSAAARSSASATARSSTSRATPTARSTGARSAPRARPPSSSPSIPNRLTKVWYRAPHATEWERERPRLGHGPHRRARQGDARRHLPRDLGGATTRDGKPVTKRVNHCTTIASLGGATMDNEWNYVQLQADAGPGAGLPRKPGPDMTQLDRARSGHFVRPRRRHDLPDGPAARRQHPHHGLEHGRVPPGRLPLGDAGEAGRGRRSSTPTRASPAPRPWPTSTPRCAPAATSSSSAP